MNKSLTNNLVGLASITLSIGMLVGCGGIIPKHDGCIQPTVEKIHVDYDRQAKLSAKLDKIQVGAELEAKFKKTIDIDYAKLSDKHRGMELLLRAAECYKKQGWSVDEIERIFRVILVVVRENAPEGQKGGGPQLTDKDRDYINQGANAMQIFKLLDDLELNK